MANSIVFRARPLSSMGAHQLPILPPKAKHFPQLSSTEIMTLAYEGFKNKVKKSPPESSSSGFIIGGDPVARVAHLEHSVRFLQEQHRLMLSGLHAEIEALRERNRDLQFQLIFNKESSAKVTSTPPDENSENNETKLKREITRLEREASAAKGEAKVAEARAVQLQKLLDAQTEKLRELELKSATVRPEACSACGECGEGGETGETGESRGSLRARLGSAERLVRRLRGDAERQRRELQCMKSSLHASLRAAPIDAFGFQNNYHFPPVHTPDFWREPLRDEFSMVGSRGRSTRRPLTLPELSGQQMHRSTVYANNHTRPRANGYEKNKKPPATNGDQSCSSPKSTEEPTECRIRAMYARDLPNIDNSKTNSKGKYPELKMVVTKLLSHSQVSGIATEARPRPRRPHRKHAPDHT